jgi:hypothetical protein
MAWVLDADADVCADASLALNIEIPSDVLPISESSLNQLWICSMRARAQLFMACEYSLTFFLPSPPFAPPSSPT